MLFNVKPTKDSLIKRAYRESMRNLQKFYAMKWKGNPPLIFIVDDRKTIDALKNRKTEPWLVGWANRSAIIFLLNFKNLRKESSHRYSEARYRTLIKHELSHLFINLLAGDNNRPVWLHEGVAIYTSGQNRFKTRPSRFKKFLSSYNKANTGVYKESGFVIELLIKRFGKKKLLQLIKSLKRTTSKKQFYTNFGKILGFELNYKILNNPITGF